MTPPWKMPHFELSADNFTLSFPTDTIRKAHQSLHQKFVNREVGFFDWPVVITGQEIEKTITLARRLREEFDGAFLFGIGGSYLGPAAVLDALRSYSDEKAFPLYWLSNTDAPEIMRAREKMGKGRFASIVITKSGNTVETLSSFFHLSRVLDPKGIVTITDPDVGELRRLTNENGWANLAIPPNIGGRFSVLTSVGLLPAALAGLNILHLIEGAKEMRAHLAASAPELNPAYLFGAACHGWDTDRSHPLHYLMPYQRNLKLFADWFVQLWAESLGKRGTGFTPVSALGSTDQHSLLQLFKEGPRDKVVGFIAQSALDSGIAVGASPFQVKENSYLFGHTFEEITYKACLATQKSLMNARVPTYRIEFSQLTEKTLGALFFFFETACAFSGELYGINAFDQPGVEEAKKLLRASLG